MNILLIGDKNHLDKILIENLEDLFKNIKILDNFEQTISYYQKIYNDNILILYNLDKHINNIPYFVNRIHQIKSKQKVIAIANENSTNNLFYMLDANIDFILKLPITSTCFMENIILISKTILSNNKNELKDNNIIEVGQDVRWNKENKMIFFKTEEIKLTKKEILLISILTKESNRIYTNKELINLLWDNPFNTDMEIKNLTNLISRLKKKIPNLSIKNIYDLGYKI